MGIHRKSHEHNVDCCGFAVIQTIKRKLYVRMYICLYNGRK